MRALRWTGLVLMLLSVSFGSILLWLAVNASLGYGAIPWIGIGLPVAAIVLLIGAAMFIASLILARIPKE